jgi:hypothetical protein
VKEWDVALEFRQVNGHGRDEDPDASEPQMPNGEDLLFRVLEVVATRAKESDEAVTRALERWNTVHNNNFSTLLDKYVEAMTRIVVLETERKTEKALTELSMEASTHRAGWISLAISILGIAAMIFVNLAFRH